MHAGVNRREKTQPRYCAKYVGKYPGLVNLERASEKSSRPTY